MEYEIKKEYGIGREFKSERNLQCIYLVKNKKGHYKIGISQDVIERINCLSVGNSENLELIYASKKISNAIEIERHIHKKYKKYNIKGEWFDFSNKKIDEVIRYINCYVKENGKLKILDIEKSKAEIKSFFEKHFGKIDAPKQIEDLKEIRNIIMSVKKIKEYLRQNEDKEYVENNFEILRKIVLEMPNILKVLSPQAEELYGDIIREEFIEFTLELGKHS